MTKVEKSFLRDLHKPSWATFWLAMVYGVLLHVVPVGIVWSWREAWFGALVPLVLVQALLMHAYLLALHEAVHGGLCPVGFINGYLGRLTGVASFTSLTLYRELHHPHHAYLGTVRDEEFWPFTDPKQPRWKRRLAAVLALTCGVLWTPFVFWRGFFRPGSPIRGRFVRRLIWLELSAAAAFWCAVAFAGVRLGVLPEFLLALAIPALIAGNLNTWRQFAEHIGLTGRSNQCLTRSVRSRSWAGRMLARSLFQEPLHDVHHIYPKIPHEAMPIVAASAEPLPPEVPVFRSYTAAVVDLLRGLSNPKFGKEWAEPTASESPPAESGHALRDSA